MNVSVILAHPNPASFNHAIAGAAAQALRDNGHEVSFHDLYAERFDPLLPTAELTKDALLDPVIRQHCAEMAEAQGIIVVHPNWWGQPPAILTGWVDRVLRMGVAYKFGQNEKGEGVPIGLLKARAAVVFNTSNTPYAQEMEAYGDPLETLWNKCVFNFCGVKQLHRTNYSVVITSTPEQRHAWLEDVRRTVRKYW